MSPCVSIVMPCYNAADHLARSIGSVRAQSLPDWELIVVDDGSRDESWSRLQQMANEDRRIRPYRQENQGAAAARNRALREVSGRYVSFLDADDYWQPDFLQRMSAALETTPAAGLVYCGWRNVGLGEARDKPFVPPDYESADKVEKLLAGCRWPIHAAMVRSSLIADSRGFDETLSSCMDYDLWLRIGTNTRLLRVAEVLAIYHHHGDGQITQNRARIALNHWRVQQKFLRAHPDIAARLGPHEVRRLTAGELLQRGYASYWEGDLRAARGIFRQVMRLGYGAPRDWLYMLPSLLPEPLHRALRRLRRSVGET